MVKNFSTKFKVAESHDNTVEPEISKQLDILLGGVADGIQLLDQLQGSDDVINMSPYLGYF